MRELLLCLCLLLQSPLLLAQATGDNGSETRKRLIYFTDKADSPFSVDRPEAFLSQKALNRRSRQRIPVTARDLPVNPSYIASVQQLDVPVWYATKWFNGVVVECTEEQLATIQALPFVKSFQSLNREKSNQRVHQSGELSAYKPTGPLQVEQEQDEDSNEFYGTGFHQANMVGAVNLHNDGNKGEEMTIAVLDAGFPGVNTAAAFEHLFSNNQISATFDFVAKQKHVYHASAHGTSVLSTIAAYSPNHLVGTAYKANFLMLRTEDAASEHQIEEINWLLAAEFADSAGADVINSSLGYTTFNPPSVSYTYQDMNGNTSLVAKAADYAAATGMLVVVSAGNDGAREWRYIATPADADSVLTVGAVDSLGVLAPFSSVGPTSDGRLKPDVVGMGLNAYFLNAAGNVVRGNGTSFSGPIVAGMATCLWQANSSLTNMELIRLLRQSGSNASTPDNNIGYGLPSYSRTTSVVVGSAVNEQVIISNPVGDLDIAITFGASWFQQEVGVQVYDVTGKLVHKQQIKADQQKQVLGLQPQKLKQGIYICRVSSQKHRATLRFLKL